MWELLLLRETPQWVWGEYCEKGKRGLATTNVQLQMLIESQSQMPKLILGTRRPFLSESVAQHATMAAAIAYRLAKMTNGDAEVLPETEIPFYEISKLSKLYAGASLVWRAIPCLLGMLRGGKR